MIETEYIEGNILGTLIMWPERYHDISQVAYPFMFSEKNRALADYVFSSISEGLPVEIGSVVHDVQAQKIATAGKILAICESPAMDEITTHCLKLREAYLIREDQKRYNNALKSLMGGEDYQAVRGRFSNELEALQSMIEIKADRRNTDILEAYDHLVKGLENDGLNGVPTGFKVINDNTGGWQAGNYIIIGARPAMGKTTFALDLCYAAALAGFSVMFVSLEMTSKEVYYKLASKRCGIPPHKLVRALVSEEELPKVWSALEFVSELPLYVFDDSTIDNTLHGIRDKARQVQREHGLSLLVIDYVQLMSGEEKKREERVSEISKGLKRTAKQLSIPVIALSQLSRATEIRGGSKRPMLSDLRESGGLEQDADIILFPYRPEYYEIMEDEEGQSMKGKLEIIQAKARIGSLRSFWFDYNPEKDSYLDIAQKPFSPGDNIPAPAPGIPASSRPGADDDIPF